MTVNDTEALKAIPEIKEKLLSNNINVPIVGDFHFNGHILLNKLEKKLAILINLELIQVTLVVEKKEIQIFRLLLKLQIN
ncbi:MAG: hypothetical protein CM15mP93_06760 [Thiotrichaceae bacterium]|nr:MAG: hypothetical protein CM15mP93_06760 [Thiotrichaceae bacterium]